MIPSTAFAISAPPHPFVARDQAQTGSPIARFQSYASFVGDLKRECRFGIRLPARPDASEQPMARADISRRNE
jgi:hypothetical protein